MKTKVIIVMATIALLFASFLMPGTIRAELHSRSSGTMIYDDVLDITWTANANIGGTFTWSNANNWANNLVFAGYDDWRLPSDKDISSGLQCSGRVDLSPTCISEIGSLFLELGGFYGANLIDLGLDDGEPFYNVQQNYWLDGSWPESWCGSLFRFLDELPYGQSGEQGPIYWGQSHHHAWAVRDGDVDSDGDGVVDGEDNCPTVSNFDQTDVNDDGYGDACVSPDVTIPSSCVIGDNPIIGYGCEVNKGVAIGNDAQIGEYVDVEKNAELGDNVTVGDSTVINQNVLIGNNVVIGSYVIINKNVTIGSGVEIGDYTFISQGVTINDNVIIGAHVTIGRDAVILSDAVILDWTVIGKGETVPPLP